MFTNVCKKIIRFSFICFPSLGGTDMSKNWTDFWLLWGRIDEESRQLKQTSLWWMVTVFFYLRCVSEALTSDFHILPACLSVSFPTKNTILSLKLNEHLHRLTPGSTLAVPSAGLAEARQSRWDPRCCVRGDAGQLQQADGQRTLSAIVFSFPFTSVHV